MIRKILNLGLVLVICLWTSSVFGHTLWLNASDYSPQIRPGHKAKTAVYFGWGHHYPVDGFLAQEKLEEFSLIGPDGKKSFLSPNPGGFLATQLNLEQSGTYILAAVKKGVFYTMYEKDGEIQHKLGSKEGVEEVILSSHSQQYAKAVINVGEHSDNSFSKPVGHKLEIIPLKNSKDLKGCGGHFLPIKVLFEGKPARYYKVYATYMGFSAEDDFAYTTSTDSKGEARIRLISRGHWLVKVDMRIPAPDELKEKCNHLHYTSTLTFEVP